MEDTFKLSGELSHEDAIDMIIANPKNIRFFQKQSDKMCYQAIGRNRDTIQYIWKHSKEFCEHVALCYPDIVHLLQDQSDEIYKIAIKQKVSVLMQHPNPSEELVNWAIDNFYDAILYVPKQTIEYCLRSLNIHHGSYRYIRICNNPTFEETKINLKKMKLIQTLGKI